MNLPLTGHSGEDYMEEEVSQDDLQRAWKDASEINDPEDEDEQQAPGHPLSPATGPKFPEHLTDPPPTTGSRPRGISSQVPYKPRGRGKRLSTKAFNFLSDLYFCLLPSLS